MDMAKGNNETLTAEQEMQLRQPIDDYVGEIQKKIDSLRADGTNRVVALQTVLMQQRETVPLQRKKGKTELRLTVRRWKKQRLSRQRTRMRLQN